MMKLTQTSIIETLKKLNPEIHQKYKATIRGVFGSWIKGNPRNESDIDILVNFDPSADLFDDAALTLFLENTFHRPVDVVSENLIRKELKESVFASTVWI